MDYRSTYTIHAFFQRNKQLAILVTLIAIGWVYNFLQVAALTPRMSLSQFGPGMNTLTFLNSQPPTAMSTLISSIPLCSNFGPSWTIESFGGSMLMWFGMVLAMMVPTLLIPRFLRPVNINAFSVFFFGYVCIWFIFCIFGVALQWGLQAYGVLDNSLLVNNSLASAVMFLIIGGVQLLKPKLASSPRCPKLSKSTQSNTASLSDDFRAGLKRGATCVHSCFPLMLVMFVFGLMNLVAMVFLTVIMYIMVNFATALVTRGTGLALIVSGILLLGLKYT